MAGRYNTWLRNRLADRVDSHGEYCADRHTRFPLVWNVPFYGIIDGTDEAKALLVEHGHFLNEADLNLQFPDFEYTVAEEAWSVAQTQLVDDLTNDDGLSMWSPETARKYGFDYVGAGADKPFRTKLENYGRGGNHVVLCSFEGITLKGLRAPDLADAIRGNETDLHLTNKWCRQLMGMLDEWDAAFTRENAERCGLYYMTDHIARDLGLFD